jgi:hypothetical protein
MEWESISVLPISSYNNWWSKQISSPIRKFVRRSQRKGVDIKIVDFNDELVKGVMEIYNETAIKRGKKSRYFGKEFETIKRKLSKDLDRSDFIGAYYNNELIGIMKVIYSDRMLHPVIMISKIKHNDKFPNNAFIAKAVEICDKRKLSYCTYGEWRRGNHAAFLRRQGFKKKLVPRYYIPLTIIGRLALKLKLHRGIKGVVPKKLIVCLRELRSKLYTNIYAQN